MATLQGPVIYPTVRPKLSGSYISSDLLKSRFWGYKGPGIKGVNANVSYLPKLRKWNNRVNCSYSSSSNDNNSTAENFNENDENYVNSSILEAVEVKSGPDGFSIKMRDGKQLRCSHNNPQAGRQPDYAPHPAIVLKMEDGTGLLLPIIVSEMPSVLLMAALRNVQIARPTMYQVVQEMIDKMGYSVKLVRVTKREREAYFAQLYLTKLGSETENVSFDLRPSDAINIAVRCKVPIQVNKHLVYSDGMRVMEAAKVWAKISPVDGRITIELDRPGEQPCMETKEFDLARNMWTAADEERYKDAALWRDKLIQFKTDKNWT